MQQQPLQLGLASGGLRGGVAGLILRTLLDSSCFAQMKGRWSQRIRTYTQQPSAVQTRKLFNSLNQKAFGNQHVRSATHAEEKLQTLPTTCIMSLCLPSASPLLEVTTDSGGLQKLKAFFQFRTRKKPSDEQGQPKPTPDNE